MRIERLSVDQFTIFLTFDDLMERGFTKTNLMYDASTVTHLFSEMMEEVSDELGMELEGELLVQVHLMQAQGMHIYVTHNDEHADEEEDYLEMKLTLDESSDLLFSFDDFEDVIHISNRLSNQNVTDSTLYVMDDRYYLLFKEDEIGKYNKEDFIAILCEFSKPSILTIHRLDEYGKCLIKDNAIQLIAEKFN